MLRAACRDLGPELFYPDEGDGRGSRYDDARSICATCPVYDECTEHARLWNEQHGCWGGASPRERRPKNGEQRELAARCAWCRRTFRFVVAMRRGWQNALPRCCSDTCEQKVRAGERDEATRAAAGRERQRGTA